MLNWEDFLMAKRKPNLFGFNLMPSGLIKQVLYRIGSSNMFTAYMIQLSMLCKQEKENMTCF